MKGAEKIFIHGEEIARAKDVAQSKQEVLNTLFQEDANIRNEFNQRVEEIPVFYPQDLVDNGFDYSYEDTTQLSSVVVEVLPYGSGAGFTLQDDGWYHADNVGVDQSYAMAKIIFHNESDTEQEACVEIHQVAEQGCDFFVTSYLNTALDDSIEESMNVDWAFGEEGNIQRNIIYSVPVGDSYITIKYRKDDSVNAEGELARFKASASYPVITERRHMATTEGVEEQIKEAVSTVYKYKGSVADEASLPATDNEVGDVYNCEDTGNNFAWTGTAWDKLAGTVDMSNYYTKAQSDASARAIADEKIAAIPVNDLLHYKGHVETVGDLPSLGQATGESIGNRFTATSYSIGKFLSLPDYVPFYITNNTNASNAYNSYTYHFTLANKFNGSWNSGVTILTEYPEQISIGTYRFGSEYFVVPVLNVKYDPDKPVYLIGKSDRGTQSSGTNGYAALKRTVVDGVLTTVGIGTVTSPQLITQDTSFDFQFDTRGGQNGWGYTGTSEYYTTYFATNYTGNILYKDVLKYSDSSKYFIDTLIIDGYNYNEGMIFISNRTYQKNQTITKLGDTYTVGVNHDIYYRNKDVLWEHWSKSSEGAASNDPTVYYMNLADNATDAPEVLAVAQEIYSRIASGDKDIVVVYKTKINSYFYTNLCFYDESQSTETKIQFTGTFSIPQTQDTKEINGYTQIALYRILFTITATDGVVTKVTRANNWADMAKVLAVSDTTQPAYMATKPWHPVSKQYADNVSKVVKQVNVLPEREWVTWDNASDLSGKTVKISESLHSYNMMHYDPESTGQYKTFLTSDNGYAIAIDTTSPDDYYRYAWVLLKDGSLVQTIARISEYEYEDYIVENNVLPNDVGVFTSDVLGTSEMPDALIYLGGFPQDFIYQVGTELHISIGESFVKLVTA